MNAIVNDLARAANALPSVRLLRGDAVTLEPVRWLWPGFLPAGNLTILGGPPGCGKTTIASSMAANVTRGDAWPDGSRCAALGDVIVWSGEDPQSVIAARLAATGADLTRVHFICFSRRARRRRSHQTTRCVRPRALDTSRLRGKWRRTRQCKTSRTISQGR